MTSTPKMKSNEV